MYVTVTRHWTSDSSDFITYWNSSKHTQLHTASIVDSTSVNITSIMVSLYSVEYLILDIYFIRFVNHDETFALVVSSCLPKGVASELLSHTAWNVDELFPSVSFSATLPRSGYNQFEHRSTTSSSVAA
jgi:hypothetical protein